MTRDDTIIVVGGADQRGGIASAVDQIVKG
jgi:hypothetical protein